ncbi:hypothetical protein FIM57_04150 [Helicobacter pylori]|uniref:hypothetical protein n=1 Tax=Helicobacter pylori TaxID=210 RepID=UPI00112CEFB3|nr:hypothetical protein [Helicobacter pylori]TPH68501.1 hypothetical protein FIM57_04150 [Helicobacter pylori]
MKQKVHSVSYLAKAEFEFEKGIYDLVALPSGAEVVKVSLEVSGAFVDGNISVGFKDETEKDYFLVLDKNIFRNEEVVKTVTSTKDYTATSNKVIVAEVANATKVGDVKCVLRVLYFLPSVIEVEY